LGELIAYAECAGSLARRAALLAERKQNEKADQRFDAAGLAAVSRVFAREAAQKIASDGVRLIVGSGGVADAELIRFSTAVDVNAIQRAQAGLLTDMDYVADILYGRAAKRAAA
jgi:alkylation response protein AidB-like acyl-CoA dehydrogenase